MFSHDLMMMIRDCKARDWIIDLTFRDTMIANLLFLHDAVVGSERLLEEAADEAGRRDDDVLESYFRRHLEEERGHLGWLRDDLVSAGISPGLPNSCAMALVGSQYYLLKHQHPVAMLGYLAVVEGDPAPIEQVELLERLHGKALMRFVCRHAMADLEHRKELWSIIDAMPSDRHVTITYSALNALGHFAREIASWRLGLV